MTYETPTAEEQHVPGAIAPLPDWLRTRKVVCLDFDGVFLDSNRFKTDCMHAALTDFDKAQVDPFLAYFRMNFGNSRQYHFQVFHAQFLCDGSDFDAFYDKYSARYASLVDNGYATLSLTPGCRDLLEALHAAGVCCHIVTGGDPVQVHAVLDAQDIKPLLASVRGAPEKKANHIQDILRQTGCSARDAIMFGDGTADCKAAVETGLDFVFVSRFSFITQDSIAKITEDFRITYDLNWANLTEAKKAVHHTTKTPGRIS